MVNQEFNTLKILNKSRFFFTITTLLILLMPQVNCDQCLLTDDGSRYLNTEHEYIYNTSSCSPCLQQCKSCSSINDTTCASGNC